MHVHVVIKNCPQKGINHSPDIKLSSEVRQLRNQSDVYFILRLARHASIME